jgi:hypothetical protein
MADKYILTENPITSGVIEDEDTEAAIMIAVLSILDSAKYHSDTMYQNVVNSMYHAFVKDTDAIIEFMGNRYMNYRIMDGPLGMLMNMVQGMMDKMDETEKPDKENTDENV